MGGSQIERCCCALGARVVCTQRYYTAGLLRALDTADGDHRPPYRTAVEAPPLVTRDALEGKGPQRQPQQPLHKRLEEAVKAVAGGYCRLQMPLQLALGVRGTVAGHRLGALEGGGGGCTSPPFQCIPDVVTN